jgi:hypothetical protein
MAWMAKATKGPSSWVNPSLHGITKNHLKEWLRNKKQPNYFLGPFLLIFFTTIILFYFHFYPLQALIYGLMFIWEYKKLELRKTCIPN